MQKIKTRKYLARTGIEPELSQPKQNPYNLLAKPPLRRGYKAKCPKQSIIVNLSCSNTSNDVSASSNDFNIKLHCLRYLFWRIHSNLHSIICIFVIYVIHINRSLPHSPSTMQVLVVFSNMEHLSK